MNTSGIHPKGWAVLIRPLEIEEKTESGIVIAQKALDQESRAQNHGILIECGSFAWNDEPEPRGKVGDLVIFGKWKGEVFKGIDGLWYRIMNDKDIIATAEAPVESQLKMRDRSGIDGA